MNRKSLNSLALVAALTLYVVPADAHCGSCGADSHAHAEKTAAVELQAIFPLAESAGFSTLIAAVKAAGLEGVLTNDGPFTVFAPTDEAFAKLPAGTVEALLANPEALKRVLLYHVAAGSVMAADVMKLKSAETLGGQSVNIDTENGVRVNDSLVVQADIQASNGVIHVIDTVLIPENL
jgi:uncharacterized surface protein with fasciclin (FAS1) repeats